MKSANQLPAVSRIQSARFPEVTAKRSLSPRRLVALLLFALGALQRRPVNAPVSAPRRRRTTPLAWLFAAFALSCLAPANAIAQTCPSEALCLGTVHGLRLNLILPVTTTSGKTYYFLDASGDGIASLSADLVTLSPLSTLLNNGTVPMETQLDGHNGRDDERSVIVDSHTLVLPTAAEYSALHVDQGSNPPTGWRTTIEYMTSNVSPSGQPTIFGFGGLNGVESVESESFRGYVAFQVLPAPPTFGATITDQIYTATTAILTLTLPLASNGTTPLSYTLTPTASIPAGLNFDPAPDTRTLSGTPTTTTPTTATLTYTVTDSATPPRTESLIFTVTVEIPPIFDTTIPDQTYYTGNEVDFTLPSAIGGIGAITYTLTPTTSIPAGLTFNPAPDTRTLSSMPTILADDAETAAATLIYTVTDSATPPNTASLTFSVEILPPIAPTAAPTNVMLFPSDGEILVTWTPVDDADNGGRDLTGYTATAIGGAKTFTCSPHISLGNACLLTDLTNDTQYSVTVVANNGEEGNAPSSVEVTATPRAAPDNTPPTAQTVPADFALTPDGFAAGDSFRLLFVTTATTTAESSHISLYNDFVQTSAAGGHSAILDFKSEFRALISTGTVDARDNTDTTGTGVPIYWLNSNKVADNYTDFYDGSWASVAGTDESGGTWVSTTATRRVWTGSNADGTKYLLDRDRFAGNADAGSGPNGTPRVRRGDLVLTGAKPEISADNGVSRATRPLYALSPVLTVNQAPTAATAGIPDQTAPIDIAFTYTFPETTFADADGIATLTYSASKSPDAAWLTFDSASRTFSGTPTAADVGIITITVTASDGSASVTDDFTVTVTDTDNTAATTRLNDQILTRASQAMTASTMAAVARRVDAAAGGVGAGVVGTAATPTVAYQFGGQSSLRGLLESHGKAMLEGEMEYERLLDGASLVLPLAAADSDSAGTAGAMAFWVGSDSRTLESNEDNLDWDGNVLAVHLGIDRQLSQQMMAGVALSWNQSGFDYQDEMDGSSGEYRYNSVNLHPYFGWYPSDELKLWGTLGYGQGEIEIETDEVQATDSAQLSLSGGFSRWLLNSTDLLPGGATTLNLKGDVSMTSVDVDENLEDRFAAQKVGSTRLRVLVSGEQQRGLASGSKLMPSLEVGVRYDGGDGVTGAGVELGGGLRYANPGGDLSVAGNVRTLLVGEYDELGVDFTVQLAPGSGRGLSFSLRPVWGRTQSAAERLWDEGASEITGGDTALQGSVDTEVGYGVAATMLGSPGILTPYTGMTAQDGGSSRLRLGGRFVGGNGLSLNLEGAQKNTTDSASHQVLLRGEVAF